MPALPRRVMNSTVFLYRTEEEARSGLAKGASGFIVGVPAIREEFITRLGPAAWHLYAVTAAHVIVEGARVIRYTTRQGDRKPPIASPNWILHDVADSSIGSEVIDLAIAPLGMKRCQPTHRRLMPWIESAWLATSMHREVMTYFGGPTVGDEVFMVGRFSGIRGGLENNPVARFGYIASLPLEIPHGSYCHPSYLVEMRSINMYSGSPVFSYVPLTEDLADTEREEELKRMTFQPVVDSVNEMKGRPWVLGVDVGHIKEPVTGEADDTKQGRKFNISMFMNSVMSVVTPADYIREMLKMPDLEKQREQEESIVAQSIAESNVVEDFGGGSEDEPPMTRETFFDALRRASRPTDGNSEAPRTEGSSETSE